MAVELTVVGSINLDLVARVDRLPRPGETVGGAQLGRYPGGKGANQAVAAARLGAKVRMIGAVGTDPFADEALAGLEGAGVELELERVGQTGVALIYVDDAGETEIVVAPGANRLLTPRPVEGPVLCQLEIPLEVVHLAAEAASFFALNAAPARPILLEPDLLVVNELEYEIVLRGRAALATSDAERELTRAAPRPGRLTAVTYGARGAVLLEDGEEVARAEPPQVTAVDGTGAGDAFTACLTVSLLEERPREEALRRACAAGALAASQHGAQPSMPTADDVDAILAG